MLIRFHSVTDVITNSSTIIYTRVADGAIEGMKALIEILTGEPSDNRFTVRATAIIEDNVDWLAEQRWEYMLDLDVDVKTSHVKAGDLPLEPLRARFEYYEEYNPDWWSDWDELGINPDEMENGNTYLEVKAINEADASAAKALSNLDDLFHHVEGFG